jgi:hypothetical protein
MRRPRPLLVFAAALVACTSKPEGLSAEQRLVADELVGSTAPSPRYPLVAVFDERVRLLGYDLEETEWRPGESLRVTWYWEVLAPPRPGSRLVTRLESGKGARSKPLDGGSRVRQLYGPEHWRAGDFVRDEEALVLPSDWSEPSAMLRVGLGVDEEELGHGPAIAIATPTSAARPSDFPMVSVIRTRRSPRLDGALADEVWSFAESTDAFARGSSSRGRDENARARLLWDSRFLYVGTDVRSASAGRLRLAIDPMRRDARVLEVEVSSKGEVSLAEKAPSASRVRAAVAEGARVDDSPGTFDYSYEIAIPWQAFSLDGSAVASPEAGERWKFDAVLTFGAGDGARELAWSADDGRDFHVRGRFGILRFEGAPAEMRGSSAPIELPEGRMPAPMRRSVDPTLRDSLMQQNASEKRRIDALRAKSDEPQRLESSGDGH